jgi:hypothetical protein
LDLKVPSQRHSHIHVLCKGGVLTKQFSGLHLLRKEVKDGATTQLYLAAHPDVESKGFRGQYFIPLELAKDPKVISSLESLSQKLVQDILELEGKAKP